MSKYQEKLHALVSDHIKQVDLRDPRLSVRVYENNKAASVEVTSIYGLGSFINFEFLSQISELMGTKKISLDTDHYSGCDTCDYGSETTVYINIEECQNL